MGTLKKDLFATNGVDGPEVVVRSAKSNNGTIRGPAYPIKSITGEGRRGADFLFGYIPDLDFAKTTGRSSRGRQKFSIRGKSQRLNPLGNPDKTSQDGATVGLVKKDLMKTRNRQHRSIGGIVDRRNHRRKPIYRRMFGINRIPSTGGGVVFCPFLDPTLDQFDIFFRQRFPLLRHFGWLGPHGQELGQNCAFIRLANNNPRCASIGHFEKVAMGSGLETTHGLGGLMATIAVQLENRPDLLEITYRRRAFTGLWGIRRFNGITQNKPQTKGQNRFRIHGVSIRGRETEAGLRNPVFPKNLGKG